MTVLSYTVAPKDWRFGQTFEGKQFETWCTGKKIKW
jgi:hypothetical protein